MPDPGKTQREVEGWIVSARAGSGEDLGRIAQTYRDYLLLIANQEMDAQLQGKVGPSDVVQETLLQLQRNFHQFRGQSEPELLGWLRQILRNQLLDTARHYQTGKRQLQRERPLASADDSQDAAGSLKGSDLTPGSELIAREEQDALFQALERLPQEYREVIRMRSLERLPFAEVGRQMDRSEAAVTKLWARAIERLQNVLDDPHADGE